jgi:hypothetical protein
VLKILFTNKFLQNISAIPFSALSIFGAKPPSSPTLVASRPYSALILKAQISLQNHPIKNMYSYKFFK